MASVEYSQRFVSEGHSELYAKYRPQHPQKFFEFIVEHLSAKASRGFVSEERASACSLHWGHSVMDVDLIGKNNFSLAECESF